jgi:mono/diheme cytochrome c family protein
MKLSTAIAMVLLLLTGAVHAQDAGEPRRGQDVARANCSTCHAISRNEQASPNPSAPPFQRVADTPGMTAIALNHLMHSAHKTMPLIILPPEEQSHLVAYVLSLRSR